MKADTGTVAFIYLLLGFIWFVVWPLFLLGKHYYPQSKRAIYGLVLPLFIFVSIIAMSFFVSIQSQFCAVCHVMEPYVTTWKKTTHAKVSCYRCHADQGTLDWGIERTRELILTITNNYSEPLNKTSRLSKHMSGSSCEGCHVIPKKLIHQDGIVISHGRHAIKKITCAYCHNRVAHRQVTEIAKKSVEEEKELGIFVGTVDLQPDYHPDRGRMRYCVKCHNGKKGGLNAPNACRTCHTSDFEFIPLNHLVLGFAPGTKPGGIRTSEHGKGAKLDRSYCLSCHKESTCNQCHSNIRMPHPAKDWTKGKNLHAVVSKTQPQGCMTCHKKEVYCTSCHHKDWKIVSGQWWNKDAPAVSQHINVVNAQGPAACLRCHKPTFCNKCHIRGGLE